MFRLVVFMLVCLLATPLFAAEPNKTDEQKTFYAIGMFLARQLSVFNLTPSEIELVKQGLSDSIAKGSPIEELESYQEKIQELALKRRGEQSERTAAADNKLLEKAAQEKGAVKSESGLISFMLKEGSGASPKATDTVVVNYRGTLTDGKEFDSSYKRNEPLEIKVESVIPCWVEGLQKMKVGGKVKLLCPSHLAYGEEGAGEILPGAALVFELELVSIKN
ncbi:MAG: FKBP-type peptidyl-prolyl cis-trans isomerase [Desulfuromonadaceae bacterium]|nr:FKBP-type peptidyl-prolyl cis-trans isomerase [Desulfuromonadaceae bacterium]